MANFRDHRTLILKRSIGKLKLLEFSVRDPLIHPRLDWKKRVKNNLINDSSDYLIYFLKLVLTPDFPD